MIFVIELLDADIHVVMRDDMADLGRHGLDDRVEFKLPGEQTRYAHIVVKQRAARFIQHVPMPSQASSLTGGDLSKAPVSHSALRNALRLAGTRKLCA
jgi:hypothetical protein